MLSFFPRGVLDEILNLIESASEEFPSYSYRQTSAEEKSVTNHHISQNATRFDVSVDEDQERLPTFYWLPKLHKQPYKSRFIANSSSCTTTEISKLLTSCLTSIKNHVIKYCEKFMKGPVKIFFGHSKIHVRVINKGR